MNILLWILQVALGAMFLFAGVMKTFQYEKAKEKLPWVVEFPRWMVAFIGISELLGGLGLLLPGLTGLAPFLTPVAALGLAVIMLLAAGFHARRNERPAIGLNALLFVFAGFIAFGRWVLAPL